jgi:hypothetical protein
VIRENGHGPDAARCAQNRLSPDAYAKAAVTAAAAVATAASGLCADTCGMCRKKREGGGKNR